MSPSLALRKKIAEDTLARTPSVAVSTPHASLESKFIKEQLPPLDQAKCPHFPPTKIRVVNSDAFTAAREIIRGNAAANGHVAVLNLASDERPAGGWLYSLSTTQEEALCYSSTLYATLKEEYYPWPNLGPGSVAGVFSPAIVVFKDDLDHNCVGLSEKERVLVSVVTVAAPRWPKLTEDQSVLAREQDSLRFGPGLSSGVHPVLRR